MSKTKKLIIIICSVLVAIIVSGIITISILIKINGKKIDYISASSTPNKIEYFVGETANYIGLEISATQKNGDSFKIDLAECEITGFDASKANLDGIFVYVRYQEFVCYFKIIVKDIPDPTPILSGISISTMPKTEYSVGDPLSTSGGIITRHYSNGSTANLSLVNSYVSGFDSSIPGEVVLTVTYSENGVMQQTTYTIIVS